MNAMPMRVLAPLVAVLIALPAQAGLFDDDEARKAILELRERMTRMDEQQRQQREQQQAALAEQTAQIKRSLLELNDAIEALRTEIAKLRGNDEQLARDIADIQRRQKDVAQGIDERIRGIEPVKVTLDGRDFTADPAEKRQYDEAINVLRSSDFAAATNAFNAFIRRYPTSGYTDAARFWLGNAQYGKREYKESILTLRGFVSGAPEHPRAPEALLAIANNQLELKDSKSARATLDELLKKYPKSEAALAGKDRLALLR